MNIDMPQTLPATAQPGPRPFREIPPLWLQLPHMDKSFFAAEMPHSSNLNTFFAVLVYAGIATACVLLISLARLVLGETQSASALAIAMAIGGCFTLIGGPLAFYFNTGIYYLGALVFGGKGTFSQQAYLHTMYFIPLAVISSLATFLQLIPGVGLTFSWLVLGLVVLVDLFFQIRAFQVVHGFSEGRATAAVLTPFILVFGLVCLSVAAIGALLLMAPNIGNVFSSINQSLMTPTP
jgi:hypothetical protein